MNECAENSTDEVKRDVVTAALLIIGDEILSGRTVDKNINALAVRCTEIGIRLMEVRVVMDDEAQIISALNALRFDYSYVFTTGGIGPTHDDITAQSVARAFSVPLLENSAALAILQERYPDGELTQARRLMARVPEGGELVHNSISAAPGFVIENVIVMAGVPKIVEVMLDDVIPRLKTGVKMLSSTLTVHHPESSVANDLLDLQTAYQSISIGSYPYFHDGEVGTTIVLRGVDHVLLDDVTDQLKQRLLQSGKVFSDHRPDFDE